VIPADVYSNPDSLGRGGWTWYTGSAAWYYRAITESILGLYREGNFLRIDPSLPRTLSEYKVSYKFGKSTYEIRVKYNPDEKEEESHMVIGGERMNELKISLIDNGEDHYVDVYIV
jgi:cellobiose phosphorylase